jgi:hypothetical protein
MLKEVAMFGKPLDLKAPAESALRPASWIGITPQTYDPKDGKKRPTGWSELRAARVHAKEVAANVDRTTIASLRAQRLLDVSDSVSTPETR